MRQQYHHPAEVLIRVTESVGNGDISIEQGLGELKASVDESVDLSGFMANWQVLQTANEILRESFPQLAEVFLVGGHGPLGTMKITEDIASKLIVCELLRAAAMFSSSRDGKAGAAKMKSATPSPISRPSRPFDDYVAQ